MPSCSPSARAEMASRHRSHVMVVRSLDDPRRFPASCAGGLGRSITALRSRRRRR
jgi:hypothetical protein